MLSSMNFLLFNIPADLSKGHGTKNPPCWVLDLQLIGIIVFQHNFLST